MKAIFLKLLLSAGLFSTAAFAQNDVHPLGDGMPLPWPFPWAKECTVSWDSLQGRYLLTPSKTNEHLDLKISVIESEGSKILHVFRFGQSGRLVAKGEIEVSEDANGGDQRAVGLWLHSLNQGEPAVWADLKIHYTANKVTGCPAEMMTPILTLNPADKTPAAYYQLIKVEVRP